VETFIVRLWAPSPDLAEEISPGELHGSVEHVGSKDSRRFANGDDLLEIFRIALDPPGKDQRAAGRSPSTD
jgi:hypothetical protein